MTQIDGEVRAQFGEDKKTMSAFSKRLTKIRARLVPEDVSYGPLCWALSYKCHISTNTLATPLDFGRRLQVPKTESARGAGGARNWG